MNKLYKLQIISKLVVAKLLSTIALHKRNFTANSVRTLDICKKLAGSRVNEDGKMPGCGVVPKFSDDEVIALGITAEAFGFDSGNLLFRRLQHECKEDLPNLISRRQFNARRKLTARVPYRLNPKNRRPPAWAYKRSRKRIETIFSQLNDNLMMIRNYAKQSCDFPSHGRQNRSNDVHATCQFR